MVAKKEKAWPQPEEITVPTARLNRFKGQPRSEVMDSDAAELAPSVQEVGVLQNLVVRPDATRGAGWYEIICGETRWEAAKLVGVESLPCKNFPGLSDDQAIIMGVIENIKRKDLTKIDEASSYSRLQSLGLTPRQIADRVGRARRTVQEYITFMDLPVGLKDAVRAGRVTFAAARQVQRLPTDGPWQGEASSLLVRAASDAPQALSEERACRLIKDRVKSRLNAEQWMDVEEIDGTEVLPDPENHMDHTGALLPSSPFLDLDTKPAPEELKEPRGAHPGTWRKILKGLDRPFFRTVGGDWQCRELVHRDIALAWHDKFKLGLIRRRPVSPMVGEAKAKERETLIKRKFTALFMDAARARAQAYRPGDDKIHLVVTGLGALTRAKLEFMAARWGVPAFERMDQEAIRYAIVSIAGDNAFPLALECLLLLATDIEGRDVHETAAAQAMPGAPIDSRALMKEATAIVNDGFARKATAEAKPEA